jgi:CRISPR-associated protein Csx10
VPVLRVMISAQAPLVFSERRPDGQFRPSATYIPGGVLRGALADLLSDAGEQESPAFAALFTVPHAPLFHNAYPAERLLPVTAYTCKAESGFLPDRHGVYDGLIDRLCCEELGVPVPYLPRCNHPDHRGEGERVEAFGGYYTVREGRYEAASPPSRLVTRVALNRRRKVAESGLLYSPLVISEAARAEREAEYRETSFHGSVTVREPEEPLVREWLSRLSHIGSGVSRGFGRVSVTVGKPIEDDLEARVERFNQALRARADRWGRLGRQKQLSEGAFFTVLLMADAVLRADGWTPTVQLGPELLGAAGERAVLARSYAVPDYRGGWNTAWGLPKDTELVARMAGVYVYRTPASPADSELLDALRALEERGVGERRQEGFGQVRVCDPFHVDGIANHETG